MVGELRNAAVNSIVDHINGVQAGECKNHKYTIVLEFLSAIAPIVDCTVHFAVGVTVMYGYISVCDFSRRMKIG